MSMATTVRVTLPAGSNTDWASTANTSVVLQRCLEALPPIGVLDRLVMDLFPDMC